MDEGLLREAHAARERFVDAQHHTDSSRHDYHHAIRRLHASGSSTREIARSLGLSHQRVHQIVDTTHLPVGAAKKRTLLQRLTGDTDCTVSDDWRRQLLFDGLRGDAREVMLLAHDAAQSLNHHYLGTEHILLGLLAARHSVAERILTRAGADQDGARAAVERIIGVVPVQPPIATLPLTSRAKKVLSHARKEARHDHSVHTRSEHVLFGLLREPGGVAARILTAVGVDHNDIRKRIARATRACSFCARSGADVANLIAGPGVFICDRCAMQATRLTTEPAPRSGHAALTLVSADQHDTTCSFCRKQRTHVDHLVIGPAAAICTECLALCREIHDEEGITPDE